MQMSHLTDSPVIGACMLAAGLLMRHSQIKDSGLSSRCLMLSTRGVAEMGRGHKQVFC